MANRYINLKILGWRVNGDAINAFQNSVITGCFFRTQDDLFYYGGDDVRISDCVAWSDYNGAVLFVTKGASIMESSYFKDIKVIYHRAGWHYWEGGRVISFRERQPGDTIVNVQIKNVLVEDPFPAFPPFYLKMLNPDSSNASVRYDNILIENVRQVHPGVSSSRDASLGKPRNTMLGLDDARKFRNITFKNCYYNGKWLGSFDDGDFYRNNFVENINFVLDTTLVSPIFKHRKSNPIFNFVFTQTRKALFMESAGTLIDKIQVFEMSGRLAFSKRNPKPQASIELPGFLNGMYIVNIHTSKDLYTTKIWVK